VFRRNPYRLQRYLELITKRKGGIESTFQDIEIVAQTRGTTSDSAFESIGSELQPLQTARKGIEAMSLRREISLEEEMGLEAIINAELRPAIDVINGTFTVTHPLWTHLSNDVATKARIEYCRRSDGSSCPVTQGCLMGGPDSSSVRAWS
jgi:endonuclease G